MSCVTKLRRDMLGLLSAMGPLSSSQLAVGTGRNISRAAHTLMLMANEGWVKVMGTATRQGPGMKPRIYAITDGGEFVLANGASRKTLTARKIAEADKKKFYKGKECRNGHRGLRYVSNGACIDCQRERKEAMRYQRQEAA